MIDSNWLSSNSIPKCWIACFKFSSISPSPSSSTNRKISFAVNDDLSISYGERETDYNNPGAAHVTEDITGVAAAYTMGSIKIAGNINEVDNNNGTADSKDENMEIAISFAF